MTRLLVTLLLSSTLSAAPDAAKPRAFVNVNVVPMDRERVLPGHTVVVQDGRISAIGPAATTAVPAEAEVIEAEGAWLLPGLADMHAHLNADPSPDFMRLWLAEGVTTIRNLNALPEHLTWRDEVARGARIGPTIYTSGPVIVGLPPELASLRWQFNALVIAGPALLLLGLLGLLWLGLRALSPRRSRRGLRRAALLGGPALLVLGVGLWWRGAVPIHAYTSLQYPFAYVTDTEEQARAYVRRIEADGYDLIKVYDYLRDDVYLAALQEAEARGLYAVGHLDDTLPLEDALAGGLDEIAHVDELLDRHLTAPLSVREFVPVPVDMSIVPDTVARVRARPIMVVSNLVADENVYRYLEAGATYFDRPEYRHVRPETLARWRRGRVVGWQGSQGWRRDTAQPLFRELVRALHAAGVPLLTGTDVSVDGIVPWHIHRELELLVDAGLRPYEALRAATTNAGESVARMGSSDRFGVIAPGQRADLLLLREDPLADISATRARIGVMARGVWYSQAELDALVQELVASY